MTMTREQAIRNYVEHLIGDDLTQLLQHMNGYDGCFDDCVYKLTTGETLKASLIVRED